MANPTFASVFSHYVETAPCTFNITDSTLLKVLVEPFAAAVDTSTSPRFYGGSAVLDLCASSTDASIRDFILWQGLVKTTQGAGSGAITAAATTLTRASGSWITDGWKVGDIVSCFAPSGVSPVAGTEGLLGAVSAVTATVLTFTVIGGAWSAAAIAAGARVCSMHQKFRASVPVNAGNTNAIPNASFLNNPMDSSLLRSELHCGPNELLALQPVAAVGALPISVSFKAQTVRY